MSDTRAPPALRPLSAPSALAASAGLGARPEPTPPTPTAADAPPPPNVIQVTVVAARLPEADCGGRAVRVCLLHGDAGARAAAARGAFGGGAIGGFGALVLRKARSNGCCSLFIRSGRLASSSLSRRRGADAPPSVGRAPR